MTETREVYDEKSGNTSLELDKRTESKIEKPPHVKHLRYSRTLPIRCNSCQHRSEVDGGSGICTEYKKDGICTIRSDTQKMFDKYEERNADKLLGLMKASYKNNFEKLMFFEKIEDMSGALDPEVTKRMNVMNNTFKIINEAESKTQSVEVTRKTLTDDQKNQIIETLKLTESVSNES